MLRDFHAPVWNLVQAHFDFLFQVRPLSLIPLPPQNTAAPIHEIVNHSVVLVGEFPQRSSDLLNDPAFVLARMRKQDTIESWHIKSFVRELCCQDTPGFARL